MKKRTITTAAIVALTLMLIPFKKNETPIDSWDKSEFQEKYDNLNSFIERHLSQNLQKRGVPDKQLLMKEHESKRYECLLGLYYEETEINTVVVGYIYKEDLPLLLPNPKSNLITKKEYKSVHSWVVDQVNNYK